MKQRLLYSLLLLFVCLTGNMRTWALEQDANGVFQISTAQDLIDFADYVNVGGTNQAANAVLTADIDMTGMPWENAIGHYAQSNGYKGHFDGQGYTISGLEFTTVRNYHGLFGVLVGNAVVENFSVYGNIVNEEFDAIAVISYSKNSDSDPNYIRNIHSFLNITTSGSDKKVGGVLGNGNNGTTYVDRCSFGGHITATNKTNCGGIIAYIQNNSSTNVFLSNCIFMGTLESTIATTYCGGMIGYIGASSNKYKVTNCLSLGSITAPIAGSIFGYVRNGGGGSSNNYFLGTATSGKVEGTAADYTATSVSPEELISGEVCFALNGENKDEDIAFYQTLGDDQVPTLDPTHKRVYAVGKRLCDGSFSGEVTYTNEESGNVIPDHDFEDGYCAVCGQWDASYMTPVDGVFEIGTARQLRWWADYVNNGAFDAKAVLTDDLELTNEEQMAVIGTSPTNAFKGSFDGQGHEIAGFHLALEKFEAGYGYGMFGNTKGAVIKNFSISGEMSFEYGGAKPSSDLGCGLVGWPEGSTLIQNIKCDMNIYANISSHVGGVVGSLRDGSIADRCEFSGNLNGLSSANGNAGIAGYANSSTISNCIFSGHVEGDGTGYFAGILGYVNSTKAKVTNCLSVGTVENENSQWTAALVGRLRAIGEYAFNYYKEGLPGVGGGELAKDDNVLKNTTEVDDEKLASGYVTWGLNGNNYVIPAFYQSLGQDDMPVLDPTHDIVYITADGYASMQADEPLYDFLEKFDEMMQMFSENVIATQQTIDNYMEAIKPLQDIETYEEFVAAYSELRPLLDSIEVSTQYYKAYMDACAAVADYMDKNDVGGKEFDQLEEYLTTDAEPSDEFPNGTYHYIIRTHTLTNAQVEAEKNDVEARFQAAVAANYKENSDITNMVVNPNFTDGITGWEASRTPSVATVESTSAAQVTSTFTITQKLTGLKNGIYMLGLNASQRAGSDLFSQFYSSQIVANDNVNYIQVLGEDVSVEKVADDDKEYIYGDDEGYVPASAQGFAAAMIANPERYQNYVAARVTDGTLTIGIQNPGTGLGTDQVLMSNLRLVYLGKGDTECEGLDAVLESYQKRADVIVNFEYSDADDFAQYPNISAELKDALMVCSEAVEGAESGLDKIALVDRFSDLMKEVYDCRKTYIELVTVAEKMNSLSETLVNIGVIDDEAATDLQDLCDAAWTAYADGEYTTQQAKDAIKAMQEFGNLVPPTDEEGTYLISTPLQLAVFGALITEGQVKINAKLMNDLNLEGLEWAPMGPQGTYGSIDSATPFEGTFDGQGHKISNLTITDAEGAYFGLFACVSGVLKDFTITGEITTSRADFVGGVVGQMKVGQMQNVYCSVNIDCGEGSKHIGGIAGAFTNAATMTGCSYSGTLNVGANGDSFAGLAGYAGAMTMTECLFDGVIEGNEGNEATYVGGLIGYANTTDANMVNNLSVGQVTLANAAAIAGTFRSKAPTTYINNFWMTGTAAGGFNADTSLPSVTANTFEVSAEVVAGGEVAYKLNPEKETFFYQTLGQDAYPVLDSTHGVVYPVGEFTCDGEPKGELAGYSNDPKGYKRDSHNYVDGACTECHMTPDGYLGIRNAAELRAFVNKVNQGNPSLNAKLVADIDLAGEITDENPWVPAGDWGQKSGIASMAYKGHFDGQGHTIRNFNAVPTGNYFGIFGVVSTGVLIENFTIYGTIDHSAALSGSTKTSGVVGYARDTETTIRNIHSYLNINNSVGSARPGGILGSAVNGTTNVENCTYSGTLDCGGKTGNYGGIVGYVNNNTAAIVNITNCLFDGTLLNTTDADGQCGGIVGYNNAGIATLKNCLSIGTIEAMSNNIGQFFGRLNANNSTFENCYYVGEYVNGTAGAGTAKGTAPTKTNADKLASGEICYLLNGDNQDDNWVWYQNLTGDEKDAYPVLDPKHMPVIYNAYDGYHNPSKDEEDGIVNVNENENDNENLNKVGIYNLAGQRISKLQKGINIVNGKKVLY